MGGDAGGRHAADRSRPDSGFRHVADNRKQVPRPRRSVSAQNDDDFMDADKKRHRHLSDRSVAMSDTTRRAYHKRVQDIVGQEIAASDNHTGAATAGSTDWNYMPTSDASIHGASETMLDFIGEDDSRILSMVGLPL